MIRALFSTLLLVAACSSSGPDAANAAAIAKEIKASPDSAAQVLKSHGMTEAEFEALLFEIAKDPAASAAYAQALSR